MFTKRPRRVDLHAQRLGRLRHLQHRRSASAGFARHDRSAALFAAGRRHAPATASTRSSIPTTSATTPTATAIRHAELSAQRRAGPGRPGRNSSAQYFGNRLNSSVRRRRAVLRRPHDHDAAGVVASASRNKINDIWTSLLTAGEGSDDSVSQTSFGNSPFKTTQRQYFWQNDLTLPLGALALILERREEHLSTDADFAVTQRNTNSATGVYQLRYDAFALQANLRRDDSSQYGGKTTGGIALGYKLSPAWRVTAGYSTGFKAPSFNDLYYPGLLQSEPRAGDVDATSKSARTGPRPRGDVRWEARAIGYHNQVRRTHRVRVRRRLQLRAAERRPRHAGGRDARPRLSLARHARARRRSTCRIPRTTPPAICCRGARGSTARVQVLQQAGPVQLGVEFVASSLRYDDAANTVKMGGYGIVNLTVEWPFAKGLVAARARQQRVRQELPARRRLFDGRRARCSRGCAGSRDARMPMRVRRRAWRRWSPPAARMRRSAAIDDAGNVVTLAQPAQRIVSLAPHATELLFAAGAGARVVGVGRAQRLAAGGARACRASATRTRSTSSASSRSRRISSSRGRTRCRRSSPRCARAARRCSSAIRKSIAGNRRRHRSAGHARGHRRRRRSPAAAALRARHGALAASVSRRAPAMSRVLRSVERAVVHDRRPASHLRGDRAVRRRQRLRSADACPRRRYRSRPWSPRRRTSSSAASDDGTPSRVARRLEALADDSGGALRQSVRRRRRPAASLRDRASSTASRRYARMLGRRARRIAAKIR